MKNFLLLLLFFPLTFLADIKTSNAAGDVTFCVNLDCFASVTAPTVFGSFNGWDAGANPITDPDGDGTYCATINLPDGNVEYKFFFQEEGPEDMATPEDDACTLTTSGFTNRLLIVAGGPLSVDFGWESCDGICSAPPVVTTTDVTLCVDLDCFSSITAPTIFGTFNGWNAGANPITDPDGDDIYCATIAMTAGDQEYKFFFQEEGPEDMLIPEDAACTMTTGGFTNRVITVGATPLMETYGWESCDGVCSGPPVVATPATGAPDPTAPQACVISMFSGVYPNVGVDTWLTVWSAASLTDIQVAGNDTKLYESVNFLGIETTGANLIDASQMEFFHIDVWTPNMTTFRVKLVDFGANGIYQGGDDSEHEIEFTSPALDTWITYEIPLAAFTGLASTENIAQLVLSGNPAGAGTLYVDNVYFSKVAPLPVELTSFEANMMDDKVSVEWTTASEVNSDYFQVERSADGRSFQTIAKVSSNGNSAELQSYQTLDKDPFAGINYYRLTQVDFDGTEEKSNIVSVRNTSSNSKFELMRKSINGDELSLEYKIAEAGTYTMAVIDISGKVISQEEVALTEGINSVSQMISNNGVFMLVLTNGRDRIVEKVFK